MFACWGVISARGPLLASSGAAALIAGSLASPKPPSPTRGPQAAALEARLHPASGLPTEDAIVPSTYCKTQGAPTAHCEQARSLSSKRD